MVNCPKSLNAFTKTHMHCKILVNIRADVNIDPLDVSSAQPILFLRMTAECMAIYYIATFVSY